MQGRNYKKLTPGELREFIVPAAIDQGYLPTDSVCKWAKAWVEEVIEHLPEGLIARESLDKLDPLRAEAMKKKPAGADAAVERVIDNALRLARQQKQATGLIFIS